MNKKEKVAESESQLHNFSQKLCEGFEGLKYSFGVKIVTKGQNVQLVELGFHSPPWEHC